MKLKLKDLRLKIQYCYHEKVHHQNFHLQNHLLGTVYLVLCLSFLQLRNWYVANKYRESAHSDHPSAPLQRPVFENGYQWHAKTDQSSKVHLHLRECIFVDELDYLQQYRLRHGQNLDLKMAT